MKPIELREADFKKAVMNFPGYHSNLLTDFFEYWSEPDKSEKKMRFEMEKTWHLGRRLGRWSRNGFNKNPVSEAVKKEQPVTEVYSLDKELLKYKEHPTQIPFITLAKWYEMMKEKKLLKQFTRGEVEEIKQVYGENIEKCRAACVMRTFDGYANSGLTFSDIINMRNKVNPVT